MCRVSVGGRSRIAQARALRSRSAGGTNAASTPRRGARPATPTGNHVWEGTRMGGDTDTETESQRERETERQRDRERQRQRERGGTESTHALASKRGHVDWLPKRGEGLSQCCRERKQQVKKKKKKKKKREGTTTDLQQSTGPHPDSAERRHKDPHRRAAHKRHVL